MHSSRLRKCHSSCTSAAIVASLFILQSCGSSGGDSPAAPPPPTSATPGVTSNDGITVSVGGTLALSAGLALTDEAPDTVMAVPVEAGNFVYSKGSVITASIGSDGKFSLNLPQKSLSTQLIEKGLKADGSVDRAFVESIAPEAEGASDEEIKGYITELKAQKASLPERFEFTYVVVAYKASSDKVAAADTMRFIGMPVGSSPLLGLPITKAKGNLALGDVTVSGEVALSELKADSTSFDISAAALASMTTTNDALKTFKNLFINSDLASGRGVKITPTFNWEHSLAAAKSSGGATPAEYEYSGYSAYIAAYGFGTTMPMEKVCAETESERMIFSLVPPVAQTNDIGTFDASNPLTNAGAVSSPLASENGGDRLSCLVGNSYFAGTDAEGVSQIGMGIGFDGLAPEGWWNLSRDGQAFAKFDLGLSNPVADDHIKMFVPKLSYEVTNGKVSKVIIKMFAWDAAASSYREMSDLSPFKRIAEEMGIGFNLNNEEGGSNTVGGARPATVTGNAYVITSFVDQGDNPVQIGDPAAEATAGSIMLYFRAFGNSYNFFWK